MKLKSRKAAMYLGMALIIMLMPILPYSVAGTTNELNENANVESNEGVVSYVANVRSVVAAGRDATENSNRGLFDGKAVASDSPYLAVLASPDESSEIVGKLFENNIADVVEFNGQWTKISSGNLVGYVPTTALCFGDEAEAMAQLLTTVSATIINEGTTVYATNTELAEVVDTLPAGVEVTPVNFVGDYLAIRVGDEVVAYILSDNAEINYGFDLGLTIEEEEAKLAAEEAARIAAEEEARRAEEARIAAEEARKAKEAALMAEVLANTQDGTSFTYNPTMELSNDDMWLLACIVDWEAGWESYEGKLAVANVVLNRLRGGHYGSTMSEVIYARGQFGGVLTSSGNISSSFQARLDRGPRTTECMEAAMAAVSGVNNIEGYTSFLSTSIADYESYPMYTVIGGHCFH